MYTETDTGTGQYHMLNSLNTTIVVFSLYRPLNMISGSGLKQIDMKIFVRLGATQVKSLTPIFGS
jgi:hypothetical protein